MALCVTSKKSLPRTVSWSPFLIFPPLPLRILWFQMIDLGFNLILVGFVYPISFFCMWISNFPNNLLKRLSFPLIVLYFWDSCRRLVVHRYVGFYPGLLFVPLAYVPVFMKYTFLLVSNIIWNLEVWCFQLCSCSRSFYIFSAFCDSIYILGLFFLFMWKMPLEFYRKFIESVDCFE